MKYQAIIKLLQLCAFLFLIPTVASAQTDLRHSIAFSSGYTAYMTSFAVPAGFSGAAFSLLYDYKHPSSNNDNRLLYLSSRVGFSRYPNTHANTDLISPYHQWAIDITANCLWEMPLTTSPISVHWGLGTSLDAYNISPVPTPDHLLLQPYGNWGLSAEFSAMISYRFNKFTLENYFRLPIIKGGHFPLYQQFNKWTDSSWKYYLTPNTIAWLGSYRSIDNQLRLVMPYKDIAFSVSYLFLYQHSFINHNKEKQLQHALGFGVKF